MIPKTAELRRSWSEIYITEYRKRTDRSVVMCTHGRRDGVVNLSEAEIGD